MPHLSESERTNIEVPSVAIAQFRANMAQIGVGIGTPGQGPPMTSPAIGGMLDWYDFPTVVAAYAHTFPHHGPLDKRSQDWEDRTYPSGKPQLQRPKGPGESVIMS